VDGSILAACKPERDEEGSGEERTPSAKSNTVQLIEMSLRRAGSRESLQQEFPGEKENRQTGDSAEHRKEQLSVSSWRTSCVLGAPAPGEQPFHVPGSGARKEKVRDVDASDEQHQSHRASISSSGCRTLPTTVSPKGTRWTLQALSGG